MAPEPTYYVQISDPEEPERWHTVARVDGRELADEGVRLAEGSYMRTTVVAESHYPARWPPSRRCSSWTSRSLHWMHHSGSSYAGSWRPYAGGST